jgi:hypothetical protein
MTVTHTGIPQNITDAQDDVIEYPMNGWRGRLGFLKIGQTGLQYSMEEMQMQYGLDPNAPSSGLRR